MKEKFLYHFKPKNMVGSILKPLNALIDTLPDVYSEQVKKYEGREHLLEKQIPLLNCLWNDVLHLSPIDPQVIVDCWREKGWISDPPPRLPLEVFRVPLKLIDEKKTVCFQSFNFDFENFDPQLDRFWNFSAALFSPQTQVGPEQLKAWGKRFLGRSPVSLVQPHNAYSSETKH